MSNVCLISSFRESNWAGEMMSETILPAPSYRLTRTKPDDAESNRVALLTL
jgi:hypothetical protein